MSLLQGDSERRIMSQPRTATSSDRARLATVLQQCGASNYASLLSFWLTLQGGPGCSNMSQTARLSQLPRLTALGWRNTAKLTLQTTTANIPPLSSYD